MHPSIYLALLCPAVRVAARNTTIDNSSPQLIYSPTPCFIQNVSGCSTEWFFNGSDASAPVTSTNGPPTSISPNTSLTFIPRVSLTFTGSSITFIPGPESGAVANVAVDDLPSVQIDTSVNAFEGTSLGGGNHTVVVTWAGLGSGSLDVLSFVVEVEDVTTTSLLPQSSLASSSSMSLFSSPLPTHSHRPRPDASPTTVTHSPSTGTVAAIAVTAAVFVLLAGITWLFTAQRRRRRKAMARERTILGEMRMPSDGEGIVEKGKGRDLEPGPRDKGKGIKQRDSLSPPIHYIPWRRR